jgi:SAM-dependent methyltransferase
MPKARAESPYSRLNYRRLIAWPERIAREGPFLEREIGDAPDRSVVDLGCGTGEHARHLASRGFRVLGVDRSKDQIEKARDYEEEFPPYGPRFLQGDFSELSQLTDEKFGAAICLGNVLPHLEDEALRRTLDALFERLVLAGRLLLQVLNYERIFARDLRHLPLNFRDDPEESGEIVFLRLMTRDGERHVLFNPMTLVLRPGEEPPVAIKRVKEVRLRAWTRPDVEQALESTGFVVEGVYGDVLAGDYKREESPDLVIVASRS